MLPEEQVREHRKPAGAPVRPPSAWCRRQPSPPRAGPRRAGCARTQPRALDVVQERRRVGRQLEQVVEPLGAVTHPEHLPELTKAPPGELIATWEPQPLPGDQVMQAQDPLAIGRYRS